MYLAAVQSCLSFTLFLAVFAHIFYVWRTVFAAIELPANVWFYGPSDITLMSVAKFEARASSQLA